MTLTEATAPTIESSPLALPDIELAPPKASRLVSLDVFRGITIAGMILVNSMSDPKYWPMEHAEWNGWTPTDLIFPFFLFIVGVAIPFSMAKRAANAGQTRGQLLGRIWLRALSLVLLGHLLGGLPLPLTGKVPMPDGFIVLKSLRIFSFIFIYASIIALLVPWKSKRLSTWITIGVAVVFYSLLFVMHYANKHALAAGWPAELGFGGGVFRPERLRIPGVLVRIGVVYGIAATIALFAGWRTILLAAILFCGVYAYVMLKVPFAGHVTGSLTFEDNLARHVDVAVFDRYDANGQILQKHTYNAYPDNEGLLSTIPAISTTLIGILVGLWLRTKRPAAERGMAVLAMGVPVTILGVLLGWWLMPINKILWTPSYVVFCAGLAMLGLGFVFWLVDVQGRRAWALPFTIFGMNAIAAFCAAGLIPRLTNLIRVHDAAGKEFGPLGFLNSKIALGMDHATVWLHQHAAWVPQLNSGENLSLAYSLAFVLIILVLMSILYVSKIFVKV
jgi:predicted acyltransferase